MTKTKRAKNVSSHFHAPRIRIKSSHLSRTKKLNRQVFKTSRRSVLTVIILAMLVVILVVLSSIFNSPENLIKRQIETISSYYYENSFYPELDINNSSFNKIMENYSKVGLSRISARQLLLSDNEHYTETSKLVFEYCDENDTFVQIYPDPPYGRTDYHIEYHYACTF